MSHNQILFNSPALHSLKRGQLVKLCKMHSLKANGKNTELIERLKRRAADLPPDAVNFQWKDSDEEGEGEDYDEEGENEDELMTPNPFREVVQRPSEQWEIVMDNIQEVEEKRTPAINMLASVSSVHTGHGSAGEFGTGDSKSSVKSSLKAVIASSFGIKRGKAGDSNSQSGSLSSLQARRGPTNGTASHASDPFAFPDSPEPEPIPGTSSRPGAPAPANARLSTGTRPGQTTTIRLVSSSTRDSEIPTPPRLAPYRTTFDLDMGSPGSELRRPVWPASPATARSTRKSTRLYPAIPSEDVAPSPFRSNFATSTIPTVEISKATPVKSSLPRTIPFNGPEDMFSPSKLPSMPHETQRNEPRLSMPQKEPFLFGSPLPQPSLSNKQFGQAAVSVLEEMNQRLADAGVTRIEKTVLDPIEAIRAASAAMNPYRKSDGEAGGVDRFAKVHEDVFEKMDSIVNHYAARRPPPTEAEAAGNNKRKSEALGLGHGRPPAITRKTSTSETRVVSTNGRKKMAILGGFGNDDDYEEAAEIVADRRSSKRIRITEGTDVHKGRPPSLFPSHKTLEEQKKQEKEREAVRRHLNAARRRSSRGRANAIGKGAAPQDKSARLGFFATAKNLVRNVWNLGASGGKAPSVAPVAKPPSTVRPAPVDDKDKQAKSQGDADALLKPPPVEGNKLGSSRGSRGRSRSPIPSFAEPSTLAPRPNTAIGHTAPLNVKPRSTTTAGNRPALKPRVVSGSSFLAAKAGPAAHDDTTSDPSKSGIPRPKRTTSTLLQPTASSLAKRQAASRHENVGRPLPALPVLGENTRVVSPTTFDRMANGVVSPTPSKVFSKPVTNDTFSSPARALQPSAAQNTTSLASAANTMLVDVPTAKPKSKMPVPARKPRVSRSRVVAKLNQQRAAVAAGVPASKRSFFTAGLTNRTRSSLGAPTRRSLGALKSQRGPSGLELMMNAKKKMRQSEYYAGRRFSRNTGSSIALTAKPALKTLESHA